MGRRSNSSSDLAPRERFGVYLTQAEDLWYTPLVQQGGLKTGFTLHFEKFLGGRILSREPEDGALRAFLTYFRPFVSDADTVFVPKVFNVCFQCLTSDTLKRHLIESRQHWKQAMKLAGIRLIVNGREIEPERVMDLYIKHIFHPGDPSRTALITQLGIPGQVVSRHIFYNLLGEGTGQILALANIIKVALTDSCFAF